MANEDLDLDVKQSGKGIKILLIILIALVLIIGGVGGFLFFTGGAGEKDSEQTETEGGAENASMETIYIPLGKPFTINFHESSQAKFLQIEITVMARQQAVEALIKKHKPIIQDDVINIIGSKSYEELNSQEGKRKLASEILKSLQAVIETELKDPGVEAVYFTSFIMQ